MNVNMRQIEKAWNAVIAATGVAGIRNERDYEHALAKRFKVPADVFVG